MHFKKRFAAYFIINLIVWSLSSNAQIPGEKYFEISNASTLADTASIQNQLAYAIRISAGNKDSAIIIFKDVWEKADFLNHKYIAATALGNLAGMYARRGDYDSSIYYYRQVLKYTHNWTHNKSVLAMIYSSMSSTYYYMNMYDSMAYYIYKGEQELSAFRISNQADVQNVIGVYNNLAQLWCFMNDKEKTIYYCRKVIYIASKYRDLKGLGMAYLTITDWYLRQQQWDSAIYYNQQIAKLSMNTDIDMVLAGKFNESYILIQLGSYSSAISQLKDLIQLATRYKEHATVIGASYNLGDAYFRNGDYKKAEAILTQTIAFATRNTYSDIRSTHKAYHNLADIYAKSKQYPEAYLYQQKAIILRDSIVKKDRLQSIYALETKARTAEKDRDIAEKQRLLDKREIQIKEKNIWIGVISGSAILLTGLLGSLYGINKHKQLLQTKKIQILQQERKIEQLNSIMQGEEKERARLARELHDGIGGMIAAIKMNFSTLKNQCEPILQESDHASRLAGFNSILDMLTETSNEIRETAHNLAPNALAQYGLLEALKLYFDKINNSDQLYIKLEAEQDLEGLDESFQLNLYRIIQELVQNIIKHSGANNALIQISRTENLLHIFVRDNGKGISDTDPTGIGLQNTQLRVKALQGEISIESIEEHGMSVSMKFNLKNLTNRLYEHSGIDS